MAWEVDILGMQSPIICFGQQPNGFFPKRFFYAKIQSAKKLQKELGGKIVFFYHDSDADYRETSTALIDKQTGKEVHLNFDVENKIQKKHSPLYAKKIAGDWQEKIKRLLPQYISPKAVDLFARIREQTVADFCLKMYEELGLLEGMEIVRSSDEEFRKQAVMPNDYFADIKYEEEIVRARLKYGKLVLHEGGDKYTELPDQQIEPQQISAARDSRFAWMQSVINCTHYIYGEGEKAYMDISKFPTIKFVDREKIDQSNLAFTEV